MGKFGIKRAIGPQTVALQKKPRSKGTFHEEGLTGQGDMTSHAVTILSRREMPLALTMITPKNYVAFCGQKRRC